MWVKEEEELELKEIIAVLNQFFSPILENLRKSMDDIFVTPL
jgi:hypothetical protein